MREINEIGIVLAVGIDYSEATGKYSITVQIANQGGGRNTRRNTGFTTNTDVTPWVCTADGASIFEAVRSLARIASKRVTWAHDSIVIIGEPLARHDVTPVIDFFTHNPELRMKTLVAASKGEAKEYIASNAGSNVLSGLSLSDIFRYAPLPGVSIKSDMLTLYSNFTSDYAQLLISGITLKKVILSSDELGKINETDTVALEGAAVFKKSKMVGWLTPEETRGIARVLNYARGTVETVADTDYGNRAVSIETKEVKSRIISNIIDGKPSITVKVSGRGNIVEEDAPSDISIEEFQQKIGELLDEKISNEIQNGIDKVQENYKSDVLGFAQAVRVQNNNAWENGIKEEWVDIFPDIPVKTEVDIDIISSTLNQEPLRETKGK